MPEAFEDRGSNSWEFGGKEVDCGEGNSIVSLDRFAVRREISDVRIPQ